MNGPLLIITGPTAIGKTALSLFLAHNLSGEIVSADSMQVYRHMDIGSAKIAADKMQGIPHHLIDIIEPTEDFHVKEFSSRAKQAIAEIAARGNLPVMVGGTGFYIQAVLYDIAFTEENDNGSYRKELEQQYDDGGAEDLFRKLQTVDYASAQIIHPKNKKRLIRALEYYYLTGEAISVHNKRERNRTSAYRFLYYVLTDDREKIYARIDRRVDEMIEEGLVDEVKRLKEMGVTRDMTSMQGLGYKEIYACLDGECSLEDAVYRIKRDTRHFAKRQLTWFRREKDVIWLDRREYPSEEAIRERIEREVREKL